MNANEEDTRGRQEDWLKALSATAKSTLSVVPGLAQAIAGWDAYHRSRFDRNVRAVIKLLEVKLENVESFFRDEWLQSEEGSQFAWKVFDSAFDSQLEDKRELFVNALIQGVQQKDTPHLEKLKFIDMLRNLSRASLTVLAEMHAMFHSSVRGPGRPPQLSPYPHVDATAIAQKLSDRYDPYLVSSAVYELESHGLFSKNGQWTRQPSGQYSPQGGFATEMCYTDFAARFVEFVAPDFNATDRFRA